MKGLHHFQIYYFVAVVVISAAISTFASSEASAQNNSFGIKDETYTYYQKCLDYMRDSSVLSMLDTLFQMSVSDEDLRMQTVSISSKMDYYYFKGERDSFFVYVDHTKSFAKAHDLPKYYYFAWARLITYYLNDYYMNTALDETQKMQEEALAENNKDALLQSYQMMGRIYNAWNKDKESAEYFLKATEVLDENITNDRQHLTYLYITAAAEYTKDGMYEEAEEAINNAAKYRIDNFDSISVLRAFANVYTSWEKPLKAKRYIDTLKAIGYPVQNNDAFLATEMQFYAMVGDYQKALDLCDELVHYTKSKINTHQYIIMRALYLEKLGRYKESNDAYRQYYHYQDSIDMKKFSQELSERAVMLEVNELKAQQQEMELRMRTRWLILAITALLITVAILGIMFFQFYKIRGLNKKLNKSEKIKTIFLQNLSHEVRTPLNAIMGFSDIIATTPGIEKKEYEDYSKIIHNNSRQLLDLFNEALEASEVRTTKEKKLTSINDICKDVIEKVKKGCAEDVKIFFIPCEEDTRMMLDKNSIIKVVNGVLDNSVKFTKKGSITVKTQFLSKSKFLISITDTGPGIPIDQQGKVFESFYKVNSMSQGIGLGLSLCKVIADSLGGSISIDSSYTDGCRTIFVFPV